MAERPQPPRAATPAPPRLSHVGIAVHAHADALRFWRDLLGLPVAHVEHVGAEGVTVAMLPLGRPAEGGGSLELLQPDAGDNPIRRFLDKRGPGLQQLALEVDDLPGLVARLKAAGVTLIDEQPRPGAQGTTVAFVHPKSTGGVLLELVQARGARG
jgi:methylmalonyl-CoA/ethylmalonyl-CoA epimerase